MFWRKRKKTYTLKFDKRAYNWSGKGINASYYELSDAYLLEVFRKSAARNNVTLVDFTFNDYLMGHCKVTVSAETKAAFQSFCYDSVEVLGNKIESVSF